MISDLSIPLGPTRDEGHASMPSGVELAGHPELSAVNVPDPSAIPASERATNHSAGDSQVLEVLKAADVPRDVITGALAWAQHGSALPEDKLAAIDAQGRAEAKAELGTLWGDKYADNVAAIKAYVKEQLPGSAAEVLLNARDAEGRAYLNDPANLQRLLGLATKARPEAAGDVDAQIRSIEAFMKGNRAQYNKDEPLQARYRSLLAARG